MKNSILLAGLIFLLVSCKDPEAGNRGQDDSGSRFSMQSATSSGGMVSSAHPLATRAGVLMLENGGNAADAAVATAFALSVVEPSMSGLGGRQQIILRKPDGTVTGIDATTQAPPNYDPQADPKATHGYPTIGLPGVVAGLTKLLEDHGSLSLAQVMAPAIEYAENGFEVTAGQGDMYNAVKGTMARYESTRKYYFKNDSLPYQEGDLLVNKDLANTLRLIAKGGREAFYEGEIARKIASDMQINGGYLTMEVLAGYQALESEIVGGTYRGYGLHGLWLPSYGAITVEILQILDHLPMDTYSEAEWASALYQAIDLAYRDRRRQYNPGSRDTLLSADYAASLAAKIDVSQRKEQSAVTSPIPPGWGKGFAHTSHLSTADRDGFVVGLTQSLGPIFGSKVAAPGLGFVYANTMGPYLGNIGPGMRASSHISPFLVTDGDDPFLVIGCAGGSRIISAIASVISRRIDQGLTLTDALASPRVYPLTDTIQVETHEGWGWKDEILDELTENGFRLEKEDRVGRFGRIHAIEFNKTSSTWKGVADPDWMGSAAGPEPRINE